MRSNWETESERRERSPREHAYGQRKALFEEGGPLADMNFNTAVVYGWVASHVTRLTRVSLLSFDHHKAIAALPPREQKRWLARAVAGCRGGPKQGD